MSAEDQTRIQKDAEMFKLQTEVSAFDGYYIPALYEIKRSYIAGATAEHERLQNEITELKSIIDTLTGNCWQWPEKSHKPDETHLVSM